MGIPIAVSQNPPAHDQANAVISGELATTGTIGPGIFYGVFNFAVWGTFSGTAALTKSYDGGVTYIPVFNINTGLPVALTAPGSVVVGEPEKGVEYLINATTLASGTLHARMSTSGLMSMSSGASTV